MPIYAGVGISSHKDYKSAVTEAVYQAKTNLKQKEISLAIVFTSSEFSLAYLLKSISNLIGVNIPLLGATSNAIFTNDRILKHGIAITLLSTKEAYFNSALVRNALTDLYASGDNLGKRLLFGMKVLQRRFCLLFSDGLIIDNLPLLRGLQQRLGHSFPIIGATSASDNIHLNKTYQYFNQEVLNSSVVGLLWAGRVNFGLGIKHGWKPIGKPHRVNISDKFVIKEIEKKPAVSLYRDYFDRDIPALKRELKRISCLYPIGINISGEEEYLLRNILSIEDDGSLICRGDIPTGSQVRLMIGTKESALSATEEAAKETRQALKQQASPKEVSASIIFVFNSVSRLYLLGRQITKELEIIKSHFPATPIIGLCTYGEQAPLKTTDFAGKTYCHNQTIAILAMS
jgi:hypothetical protein